MAPPTTSPGSTRKRGRGERSPAARLAALAFAGAAAFASVGQAAGPKLLPADEAFRLSARALDAATLEIRFDVADGYYLYRDKLRFDVEPASSTPGVPILPPGKIHEDDFFGKSTVYRGPAVIRLPLKGGKAGDKLTLTADSQGCADAGVCYPPQRQKLSIALPATGAPPGAPVEASPRKKGYFN